MENMELMNGPTPVIVKGEPPDYEDEMEDMGALDMAGGPERIKTEEELAVHKPEFVPVTEENKFGLANRPEDISSQLEPGDRLKEEEQIIAVNAPIAADPLTGLSHSFTSTSSPQDTALAAFQDSPCGSQSGLKTTPNSRLMRGGDELFKKSQNQKEETKEGVRAPRGWKTERDEKLSFLDKYYMPRQTSSTPAEQAEPKLERAPHSRELLQKDTTSTTSFPSMKKKRRLSYTCKDSCDDKEELEILKKLCNLYEKPVERPDNVESFFNYIAATVRTFPETEIVRVKMAISELVWNVELRLAEKEEDSEAMNCKVLNVNNADVN